MSDGSRDAEDVLLAPEDGEDWGSDADMLDTAAEDVLLAKDARNWDAPGDDGGAASGASDPADSADEESEGGEEDDSEGDAFLLAQYVDVEGPAPSLPSSPEKPARRQTGSRPRADDPYAKTYSTGAGRRRRPRGS